MTERERFEEWWWNVGSGITPNDDDDFESFSHRVSSHSHAVGFTEGQQAAQDRIRRLEDALRILHDEQNGPPLLRRKKFWQAAMGKAAALLEESK